MKSNPLSSVFDVQALELLHSVREEVDKYENKDTKIGPATAELTKNLLELEIQLNKKIPSNVVHAADPDTVSKVRQENHHVLTIFIMS